MLVQIEKRNSSNINVKEAIENWNERMKQMSHMHESCVRNIERERKIGRPHIITKVSANTYLKLASKYGRKIPNCRQKPKVIVQSSVHLE